MTHSWIVRVTGLKCRDNCPSTLLDAESLTAAMACRIAISVARVFRISIACSSTATHSWSSAGAQICLRYFLPFQQCLGRDHTQQSDFPGCSKSQACLLAQPHPPARPLRLQAFVARTYLACFLAASSVCANSRLVFLRHAFNPPSLPSRLPQKQQEKLPLPSSFSLPQPLATHPDASSRTSTSFRKTASNVLSSISTLTTPRFPKMTP